MNLGGWATVCRSGGIRDRTGSIDGRNAARRTGPTAIAKSVCSGVRFRNSSVAPDGATME